MSMLYIAYTNPICVLQYCSGKNEPLLQYIILISKSQKTDSFSMLFNPFGVAIFKLKFPLQESRVPAAPNGEPATCENFVRGGTPKSKVVKRCQTYLFKGRFRYWMLEFE